MNIGKDMTESNLRGSITIRIGKELLDNYKDLCDRQGADMSKRLRLFIESEIKKDKQMSEAYGSGNPVTYSGHMPIL